MGLGIILVIFGVLYVRTKEQKWRELSFYWLKIYSLVFAMGIATGVVQEFEFGMNWSSYSRFVGNIFGSLLAAEGVFAFFLEGGFLGLMLFGGSRLGPRLWLLATTLVVFGAHFSALWIVMANSWMQTPAGYTLQQTPNGQIAVMQSFASVVFTPSFGARIFHVFVSAWLVGTSLVLSVSAWHLLRKRHEELAKSAIRVALPTFAVLAFLQVFVFGSWMALVVTDHQPTKLAGMEGLWQTTTCAPLYLVGWVDPATQTTHGIAVPCLLSYLAYFNINAPVTGLDAYPSDLWPPLQLAFQAYHAMIDLGMLFILIGLIGAVYYFWGRRHLHHTLGLVDAGHDDLLHRAGDAGGLVDGGVWPPALDRLGLAQDTERGLTHPQYPRCLPLRRHLYPDVRCAFCPLPLPAQREHPEGAGTTGGAIWRGAVAGHLPRDLP